MKPKASPTWQGKVHSRVPRNGSPSKEATPEAQASSLRGFALDEIHIDIDTGCEHKTQVAASSGSIVRSTTWPPSPETVKEHTSNPKQCWTASPEYALAKIKEKQSKTVVGPRQSGDVCDSRHLVETLWRVYYENGGPEVMFGGKKPHTAPSEEAVVLVDKVRFSHNRISSTFGSGNHHGASLETLVEDLDAGRVRPQIDAFLQLSVVLFDGQFVSLNNRRLYALHEHQRHSRLSGKPDVYVRVRILCLDPVTAKFVLSYTTANGGTRVDISQNGTEENDDISGS